MATLRLYKQFYKFSYPANTYTLINPVEFVDIHSVVSGSSSVVETLTEIQESTGNYYVELNPLLYAPNSIYEILWSIKYTNTSPTKILKTKFRVFFQNYTLTIDYEFEDLPINVEIYENDNINIDVSISEDSPDISVSIVDDSLNSSTNSNIDIGDDEINIDVGI